MPSSIRNTIAVCLGGALGAVSRVTLDALLETAVLRPGFPSGIMTINVLGGLAMGLLQGWIKRSGKPFTLVYTLLGTGFLGGFTTVSHFAFQTFTLYQNGHRTAACLNVILSVILAVGAAAVGYTLSGATRSSRNA